MRLSITLTASRRWSAARRAIPSIFTLPTFSLNKANSPPRARAIKRRCERNPDYAEAHRNLGHVEFALGNYAAAAHSYRAALRLDRNLADTRYALAQALLRTEDFAAASEQLQQVVDSEPNFAYGRYYLATALIAQKQWDKAVAQLQRALPLSRTSSKPIKR